MTTQTKGPKIYLQDVTLRDGMHAIRHRYQLDQIATICKALDEAGIDAIEVSHGDGLSGSSFNYGFGAFTDWDWLEIAGKSMKRAKLTTLLLPGIGTMEDLHRAHDLGKFINQPNIDKSKGVLQQLRSFSNLRR